MGGTSVAASRAIDVGIAGSASTTRHSWRARSGARAASRSAHADFLQHGDELSGRCCPGRLGWFVVGGGWPLGVVLLGCCRGSPGSGRRGRLVAAAAVSSLHVRSAAGVFCLVLRIRAARPLRGRCCRGRLPRFVVGGRCPGGGPGARGQACSAACHGSRRVRNRIPTRPPGLGAVGDLRFCLAPELRRSASAGFVLLGRLSRLDRAEQAAFRREIGHWTDLADESHAYPNTSRPIGRSRSVLRVERFAAWWVTLRWGQRRAVRHENGKEPDQGSVRRVLPDRPLEFAWPRGGLSA
ncbi:hypothetical protein ABIA38_007594 [Embleya sp. AB8]